ncbi:fam-b protein [Plasmodium yoelii]|uniref:Fam-b protein n=2 Tax=Plasmodium yoelii TaxID=5861 RepID=A0AAE9WLZ6_PLAYO|nr:fam-b protein [Plasmodium yoelii]WBY56523.1 fam-b protein [Plasmodium yoelii yoelii]CDU17387.1 fam-b protein [Plasmodium yoelii]VTZ77050.1 fam-b protein [Plasmodium yoelii]|eukprot:XP_022811883.1 fam-b protein [Plasmodium yoelii]
MRVSILKFVFFSIIICFFKYAKNELYFINERNIYHERNIIQLRSIRILADVDNQFDLNDFYQSTLSLANQFNDYDNDDEEMISIRNIIDSHIKKHKENNTLPDLNNVDKRTKKLIHGLHKEIEEFKKELDNKGDNELAIQPIHDKIIIKKDENSSVSEHEDFKQLKNSENILEINDDKFDDKYYEIKTSNNYKKFKINENIKKDKEKPLKKLLMVSFTILLAMIVSGTIKLLLILAPLGALIFRSWRKVRKYSFKL